MQVLVALFRARGEVVPRDRLIDACWGGRIVGDDAINRCIVPLRRIGRILGGFEIETVRQIGYRLRTSTPAEAEVPATARAPVTIAVLPFVNTSPDPDHEYFADGLSEEMLAQLGNIPGLRVTGRTSSFAFKGRNQDVRTIGEILDVAYVLEGSVRKAGSRLRIGAHLVKCADGYQLWSETFDRELGDVFAIQEGVAQAVTRALGVKLAVGQKGPNYGGTGSFEAFDHFAKAGRLLFGTDSAEVQGRLRHLRQALDIDPDYALAWATLSCTLAFRDATGGRTALTIDPEREAAAQRALALAPGLDVAHIAAAWALGDARRWRAAAEHIDAAVATGSGDPFTLTNVGGFLTAIGQIRAGMAFRQAARDADPLSLGCSMLLMRSYAMLEMWELFDVEYERSRELVGVWRDAEFLRLLRCLSGDVAPSVLAAQFEIAAASTFPMLRDVAQAHGSALKVRQVLTGHLTEGPGMLVVVAQIAGAYGMNDLALEALSLAAPDALMPQLQTCWALELRAARQHPRFKEVLQAVGLADFWRETGRWPDACQPCGASDFILTG